MRKGWKKLPNLIDYFYKDSDWSPFFCKDNKVKIIKEGFIMDSRLSMIFVKHPELRKEYMKQQVEEMNEYLRKRRNVGDLRDKNTIMLEWIGSGKSADFCVRWMRIHHIA